MGSSGFTSSFQNVDEGTDTEVQDDLNPVNTKSVVRDIRAIDVERLLSDEPVVENLMLIMIVSSVKKRVSSSRPMELHHFPSDSFPCFKQQLKKHFSPATPSRPSSSRRTALRPSRPRARRRCRPSVLFRMPSRSRPGPSRPRF